RGLFKVNAYTAHLKLNARWDSLASLQPRAEHADGKLRCEPIHVFLAASDNRGLRGAVIQAGERPLAVLPGTGESSYHA
ncbi:inner membrane CreD family protein, partial [Acinetobacter baumannii]